MPTVHLFNYPDTATEPVDFKKLIKNDKSEDAPSEKQIKRLNDLRTRMAGLLVSQPNTKTILDVIEEYIPELVAILPYIEQKKLQNSLKIKWRSSLSASIRTTISGSFEKPFVKSYSIYYEVIYVHMTYAYILSNMAIKKVTNDGSEEALNAAINDLCKAAGIFQTLSITYSSTWSTQDGPPETTSESLNALADLALGNAQQVACLKAEKKGMSPGTILKLKAGIVSKYDKCFKTITKNLDDFRELSKHFKSHVIHVMKLSEGMMLLTMAKGHVEKDEYGVAVAEITAAHNMFVDCQDAENSSVKTAALDLMKETNQLHSNYTKINNSVYYQNVPTFETLRTDYLGNAKIIVDPKTVVFRERVEQFQSPELKKRDHSQSPELKNVEQPESPELKNVEQTESPELKNADQSESPKSRNSE